MISHGKCIDQLFYVLEYVHDNTASSDRHVSFLSGLKLGLRFVLGLGSELGLGL